MKTDQQVQENSNTEGRCQRYRESPDKLQQAVNSFIALDPQLACVLTLGDIINGQHETQVSKSLGKTHHRVIAEIHYASRVVHSLSSIVTCIHRRGTFRT